MNNREYVRAITALRVYAGIQVVVGLAAVTVAVLVSGPDVGRSTKLAVIVLLLFGGLSGVYLRGVLRHAPETFGEPVAGVDEVIRGELRWLPFYAITLLLVPSFPEICGIPFSFGVSYLIASLVVERWQRRHACLLLREPRQRVLGRGVFDRDDFAVVSRRGPEAAPRA